MAHPLEQVVSRLAHPLAGGAGTGDASLSPAQLRDTVARHILEALAAEIYAPSVETELLALRQLFLDYDERLSGRERARRLAEARAILGRLQSGLTAPGNAAPAGRAASAAPRAGPSSDLPIRFAKGVGPKRAALMERVGIRTVEDALWYLPRRYEDRSIVTPLNRLRPGQRVTVCGRIVSSTVRRTARRGLTLLDVALEDDTGRLACVFYNQPYLQSTLRPGATLMASGIVSAGRGRWLDLHLNAPQFEVLGDDPEATLHVGRIVPIYPETRGLTSRQIRTIMRGLLEEAGTDVAEVIPAPVLARQELPPLAEALQEVHFPSPGAALADLERGTTPAHRRLAFEEFFVLELALALRQRATKEEVKGIRFDLRTPLLAALRARLPFELTPAQQRVWAEIACDMGGDRPMHRLIQGDVGCGKTVIALHAIVAACGSGYQAALMVPTEILAEQHYLNLRDLLESLAVPVVLLTHGLTPKNRAAVLQQIARGTAHVVIGTHALLQREVRFAKLGLAIVDEQHKFGVLQRKSLLEKGYQPDVLVLTATPIPRTLAMTVYGDLDLSVIDALPPGRKPVQTLLFPQSRRRRAYELIRRELQAGRQAYIVYPLVEESEKVDLEAALQGAARIREEFPDRVVGVLHGRMKTADKDRVMRAFKVGETQVLVATTVVEVGVDVANATVMLIEHAERFGLAQLHQLRGRVGRGAAQSYCLLLASGRIGDAAGRNSGGRQTRVALDGGWEAGQAGAGRGSLSPSRQRLEALVRSSDGFVIAEEDLRIRGPGEFFGTRQSGIPEFRAANLVRDGALLERARQEAFALLASDPQLGRTEHQALRAVMLRRWQAKLDLGEIG